jgi:hypothetical protein
MARVLLLSAAPGDDGDYNRGAFARLKKSAEQGIFRDHSLTSDPVAADLILFAEIKGAGPYFELVRRHPLVREFREKCFLFSANAFVIPFLPGVYASIEKRWSSRRTRSGFYLGVSENQYLEPTPSQDELPYLYSFVGSVENAPVRSRLAELRHPRSFFQDTSAEYQHVLHGELDEAALHNFWRRYAQMMQASKFVLCPRGLGVSSVRLFDTMRMGRVPVILSDDWVEPTGPAWKEFSIRVPEAEFRCIPDLLEKREEQAVMMGQRARREWEEWFSPAVCFHRVVESCLQIRNARRVPEKIAGLLPYLQYLRPFHFRHRLRTKWQQFRSPLQRQGRVRM